MRKWKLILKAKGRTVGWLLNPGPKVMLHRVFFWLLLLFLPLQLGRHFWPDFSLIFGLRIDYLSPTLYLTDLLVLVILVSWFWEKKNQFTIYDLLFTLKKLWWIGAVFLYLLATSLFAQNQGVAFYKLAKILELFLLGVSVVKSNQFPNFSTSQFFSFGLIYETLIVWGQFYKQGSLGGFFWFLGERTFSAGTPGIALGEIGGRLFLRPYGTFSHPNSLAGFFLVSLVLIWGLGRNLPFWFKILVSCLGVSTIVVSFSQAALFFLLLVAAGVLFLLYRKKIPAWCFIFFLVPLLFLLRLPEEEALNQRIQLSQAAISMINQTPFWGVGLNNFLVHLPQFWETQRIYFLQPVHNIFLLVASETGLVGLLIFLWFLALTFRRSITNHQFFLLLALLAIIFTGFFDHYWLTLQQNQLLAAIVFGLVWGTKSNLVKPR